MGACVSTGRTKVEGGVTSTTKAMKQMKAAPAQSAAAPNKPVVAASFNGPLNGKGGAEKKSAKSANNGGAAAAVAAKPPARPPSAKPKTVAVARHGGPPQAKRNAPSTPLAMFTSVIATMDRSAEYILELFFDDYNAAKQFHALVKNDEKGAGKIVLVANNKVAIQKGKNANVAYQRVLNKIKILFPNKSLLALLNFINHLSIKKPKDESGGEPEYKNENATISAILKVVAQWCNNKRKNPDQDRFDFKLEQEEQNVFRNNSDLCACFNKLATDSPAQQLKTSFFEAPIHRMI